MYQISFAQEPNVARIRETVQKTEMDLSNSANLCWSYLPNQPLTSGIASDNENSVFIAFYGGSISSISQNAGKKMWDSDLGGEIISSPLYDSNHIYILSRSRSGIENIENRESKESINSEKKNDSNVIVRSLNSVSGVTEWQTKQHIETSDAHSGSLQNVTLHIFEGNLLLITDFGNLYFYDKSDGHLDQKILLNSKLSALPFFTGDKIILGTADKKVILYSLSDKKISSIFEASAAPTVFYYSQTNEDLYWGDNRGLLARLDLGSSGGRRNKKPDKKPKWIFRSGAAISNIVSTADCILISSLDNFVYLISKRDGKLIWKKRFSDKIISEPMIDGRYVLIMPDAERFGLVLNLSDGGTVNKFALPEDNISDGNPIKVGNKFIFPALRGLFAFSVNGGCSVVGQTAKKPT
ncbi:MAG: PQQ-binding-like beta-propeller repeat protein [Pyrinomonadaceae bacterium]